MGHNAPDGPSHESLPKEKPMAEKYPCPHGRKEGSLVICTAPVEQTGASEEWMNFDKTGIILTPMFCVKSCPLDTPKPQLPRE